jgi:hypothetical protein
VEQELLFQLWLRVMHPGGSLEYHFAAASSKEMIRDLARVASSPLTEAIVAS